MGGYGLFGKRAIKPPPEILETGLSWLQRIDAVQCKSNFGYDSSEMT